MLGDVKTVTVEARYFVCVNGSVVGGMLDQFEAGELQHPFPFRKVQNFFTDPFEAETHADAMRAHIAEVVSLPKKKKQGRSAINWKLP